MKKCLLVLAFFLFCGAAYAQNNDSLVVLFLTDPGVRPAAIFSDGFESGNTSALFDATGDGTPELFLTREDTEGRLTDLIVVDVIARPDTVVAFKDVQGLLTDDGTLVLFHGFCDCDADGVREAVFSNENEVALIDPRDPQVLNWSSLGLIDTKSLRLLGITDLTGDRFEEIVATLPQERRVIVFADNPVTVAPR